MVWHGNGLESDNDWSISLSHAELDEIRQVIDETTATAKPIGELTRDDFKFEIFGQRLLSLRDDILNGKGFALIRGLQGDDWSDEDLIRTYWGIGTWVGDAVSQNAKSHLLGHVIDQRSAPSSTTRIYQTNQAQPFHSDSCDIVGLLCLRQAKVGGESSIASSAAIYNSMLESHPMELESLCGEFSCDRYGEIPEGCEPTYAVHIFNEINDQLVCCGMDPDIRSAQRLEETPRLTIEQLRALDLFQATARNQALNMTLERGDIQLVNNLTIVHSREAFEDYAALDKRRYLVRLWLSSKEGRKLPGFLAQRWGNIEVGTIRGGIKVPGGSPVVHLDPNT
jgi:hypothetical protein